MRKSAVCFLLAFLLAVPTAKATSQEIIYDLKDDVAHVSHEFKTNESSPEFWVEGDAYNFEVYADGQEVGFDLERINDLKVLSPNVSKGGNIKVKYYSSEVIERGKKSYFITTLRTRQETKDTTMELILPERALLEDKEARGASISPEPDHIETEGRRISVNWQWENLQEGESVPIFVTYEEPGNIWFMLTIISFIVVAFLTIVPFYQRKKQKEERLKKRYQHLVDKERKVVDTLLDAEDNTLWQKELQNATGFTKSKLSRTLKGMEEREIVEKLPHGTSNKVRLIEEK